MYKILYEKSAIETYVSFAKIADTKGEYSNEDIYIDAIKFIDKLTHELKLENNAKRRHSIQLYEPTRQPW